MIFTAILSIAYVFILVATSPLRLLDDVVLPTNIVSALSNSSGYLSALSVVVPIGTILAILALFLIVEGFILTYKLVNWVIRKIPGIN